MFSLERSSSSDSARSVDTDASPVCDSTGSARSTGSEGSTTARSGSCASWPRGLFKLIRKIRLSLTQSRFRETDDISTQRIVKVSTGIGDNAKEYALDASLIKVPASVGKEACFPAGRSPVSTPASISPTCERFVLQGIVSGKGTYQFVSRKAHYAPADSTESPVIAQLAKAWAASQETASDFIIAERYLVVGIAPWVAAPGAASSADALQCRLVVKDVNKHHEELVIPMTQVGLKFTDKLLLPAQIRRAHDLLNQHLLHTHGDSTVKPMIASREGIGRNATLITYATINEAITAGTITDTAQLDEALHAMVVEGRQARRQGYIHSEEQLAQLRATPLADFFDEAAPDAMPAGPSRQNT
ncbi:hypothetical protein QN362_00825 [Actimicrobium sp. CCC2.4]|uniref:hypothetical protein n=1 Tax=Actimicrobium sp. CCC2.4 TaxID=3048606 RepID=UPI002AC8E33D|nr:hypothetical protein [Actimicrobium sp. CCC2.4]MEB0133868.1 hypothetical protein [Actimicrobium sp. CCC2.4]WPX31409.1 hypothetical protein RHM62_14305 [Actimicrobium sp. CCC2.4]